MSGNGFNGQMGIVAGAVMARMNRDMERRALDLLGPIDGEDLLVVGFGPGVGLLMVLERCQPRSVLAIDPSAVMVAAAAERIRGRPGSHDVTFSPITADAIPPDAGPFDAAVAVNSEQFWDPHLASLQAVARVMRTGGRLVTVTHAWAVEKRVPLDTWKSVRAQDFDSAGFDPPDWGRVASGPGPD